MAKFGNDLKSKANVVVDQAQNKAGELKQDVENVAQ